MNNDRIDISSAGELAFEDWLQLTAAFFQLNEQERSILLKTLTAHSGVATEKITTAFQELHSDSTIQEDKELIIASLLQSQARATLEIESFQQRTAIKKINTESLSISRTEWLALMAKFKYQKGKNVTPLFFLQTLSMIRKVSYESLTLTSSRPQPSRSVKKQKNHFDEGSAPKRRRPSYVEDDKNNPLILETSNENHDLQAKLKTKGVRSTPLIPASPEAGYLDTARTPGKTKVRLFCSIEDKNRFFKPLTPLGDKLSGGRIDPSAASRQKIAQALPRLLIYRAEPIKFVATLASINERSGLNRGQSQKSIMKATSADVFRAHGIEIQTTDNRAHHWAHQIAYFLGGAQDSDNLIPSTAAANYNTLEAIELFIQKQLIEKKTEQITINVVPKYSGESLIPDMLIYTLTWTSGPQNNEHKELFQINPRSYQRISKSMHEAIQELRDERDKNTPKI